MADPMNSFPVDKQRLYAIAKVLEEPNVRLMYSIAAVLGMDVIEDIFDLTLEIEITGGMMTVQGERRRSSGGVFFRLAHQRMSAEQRRQAFARRSLRRQHVNLQVT